MREVLHRPPLDKEKFESNWDAIFGKKEKKETWHCKWCDQDASTTEWHACPNQEDAIKASELRYHDHRMKTLGWTDNWTGD